MENYIKTFDKFINENLNESSYTIDDLKDRKVRLELDRRGPRYTEGVLSKLGFEYLGYVNGWVEDPDIVKKAEEEGLPIYDVSDRRGNGVQYNIEYKFYYKIDSGG